MRNFKLKIASHITMSIKHLVHKHILPSESFDFNLKMSPCSTVNSSHWKFLGSKHTYVLCDFCMEAKGERKYDTFYKHVFKYYTNVTFTFVFQENQMPLLKLFWIRNV